LLGIDDEFEEEEFYGEDAMSQFMSDDLAREWLDDDSEEDYKD
jgi:hypothetical protein